LVKNGTATITARVNSSGTDVNTGSWTHTQTNKTAIAGVIDRAANLLRLYGDGIQRSSVDISSVTGITNSADLYLGARNGGVQITGPITAYYQFSRALSESEIASLSENPWQIYEPETVWMTLAEAVASGLNIWVNVDGVSKQVSAAYCLVDGVVRPITNAYGLVGGSVKTL